MTEYGKEWIAAKIAEQNAKTDADVGEAKERLHAEGKEPFDFERFREIYDVTSFMGHTPEELDLVEHTVRSYEAKYYLLYPHIQTLAEFADFLEMLNSSGES